MAAASSTWVSGSTIWVKYHFLVVLPSNLAVLQKEENPQT
jgi:hypothetical protein